MTLLQSVDQLFHHLWAGPIEVVAEFTRHAESAHLVEQIGATDAARLGETREPRPPDERHAVFGRHAAVVERMSDRGVALRHHQSMHGDDADIFLSSLGAPPFKRRHRTC